MAPVARGELSPRRLAQLDRAIRAAETASRVEFSVYRGAAEGDPREFARSLHASLANPDRSVLLMVDPDVRVIEVVTGADVRPTLSDAQAALAVAAMQAEFAAGDEIGGLTRGLAMLAEHARAPRTLHTDGQD